MDLSINPPFKTTIAVCEGFHGTGSSNAQSILQQGFQRFTVGGRELYLGPGVYFFDGVHAHAEEWGRRNYSKNCCVLKADIALGNCLDLFERRFFDVVAEVQESLTRVRRGHPVSPASAIAWLTQNYEIHTVRAVHAFQRTFPGTALTPGAKVIICVVILANISNVTIA